MRIEQEAAGWTIAGAAYRLSGVPDTGIALLDDADGRRWAELRLLGSVDTLDGRDETLEVRGPSISGDGFEASLVWELRSSRWDAKRLVIAAREDRLSVHIEVVGEGQLGEVSLLAGRAILPRTNGTLMSGAWFETLFCPSPTHPAKIVRPASESAVVGVVSGSEPGRGNWFFTPGPFVYSVARLPFTDGAIVPSGPWLAFGLDVAGGSAGFTGFGYRAVDRGFGFVLDYEAHTRIDGEWHSPSISIAPASDPYVAIAEHRQRLEAAGTVGARRERDDTPAWWREPIFCGWGAQGAVARSQGLTLAAAARFATQDNYDRFLAHLEDRNVIPGTIVIDDKWQSAYGTCEPDDAKWADLHGWIRSRHDRGQRVLLWYKAWDPEGVPVGWCVRSGSGTALAIDPTHREGAAVIRGAVRRMLSPEELDADGLKIDFTARTPSGAAIQHHGPAWGVDLLRELLDTVADEARRVKPDALLVGHTPNPIVADAVDMIRLNDTLRLDDPEPRVDIVPQMRYRAGVVAAACPGHLIDTDDWCAPDLATWRAYTAIKPQLGVPALYYATTLDLSGEDLEPADYELLRQTWAAYRLEQGLPGRTAGSTSGGRPT
jgi:hypothetical protein